MLLQEHFFLKVGRPKYLVFTEMIYLTVFEDDHPVGVSVVCSFPAIWIKSDVTVDKI